MSSFDEQDEDVNFERVYTKLRITCDSCRTYVPQISRQLRSVFEVLRRELDTEDPKLKVLAGLIDKSNFVQETTNAVAQRLAQMQLKDPYTRSQPVFWQQCTSLIKVGFTVSFVSFVSLLRF
jgi:hypothetical protein